MLELLTSIELWAGLGVMLVLYLVVPLLGRSNSKQAARLKRVTERKAHQSGPAEFAQTLRRRDPGSETHIGQMLASMRSITRLRERIEMAGMKTTPQKFLASMAGIALLVCFVVSAILGKPLLIGVGAGLLAGLSLPHMVLNRRIKKRHKQFLTLFPDGIDLMVRGLRAGLPIGESFQTVSREVGPPIGDIFAIISQQIALGVPMEKALSDAAKKMNLTEFNFFVTSIILQRETGGNLGEILNNLSEMLRQRQMMKLKIHALSSEARASAYIVGSLPFFVFMILEFMSPKYLEPLFNDFRGNMALAGAGISMGFGAFVMARMTQFEI